MIDKASAISLKHGDILHYDGPDSRGRFTANMCRTIVGPRGGITVKTVDVRVSGNCQTWKTRPDDYRLPVKHGLRESNSIRPYNAKNWHRPQDCAMHVMCEACGWTTNSSQSHSGSCRNHAIIEQIRAQTERYRVPARG